MLASVDKRTMDELRLPLCDRGGGKKSGVLSVWPVHILYFLCLIIGLPSAAVATPYIPKNTAEVLETIPQPEGYAEVRALQKRHEQEPDNLQVTYTLIDSYIKLGRQEGDPRYYGYAEAIVKPLLAQQKDKADIELLVEEANILQHRHDFDAARVLLNKILRVSPTHPQAHLMRAVIAIARGDYQEAQTDCHAVLSPAYGALLGLTCVSMVDSLNGKLHPAYATLSDFYERFGFGASKEELGWTLSVLGEMAQRLGDNKAAEKYFRTALTTNAKDYYALAALSDLLLLEHRPDEVVLLLGDYTRQDNLLLRLALAEDQRKGPRRDEYIGIMKARIAASQERKETVHLRDYARFALILEDDKEGALRMAKENWKTQKEPADAHILIDAALATGQLDIVRDVMSWEQEHSYEDVSFEQYKNL